MNIKERLEKLSSIIPDNIDKKMVLFQTIIVPYLFFIGFYGINQSGLVSKNSYRILYFSTFGLYIWNIVSIWTSTSSIPLTVLYVGAPILVFFFIVYLNTRVSIDITSVISNIEREKNKPTFGV